MSTVQRWQTPACLSLVLIAAILFVFSLGLRTELRPVAAAQSPVAAVTPAPTDCPATPVAATVASPAVVPAVVPAPFGINQNVSGSSNLSVAGSRNQTQGNDGGFGDVGLQFQNVNVLAPINIVHISNEGSGNTNSVNFGPAGPVTTTTPATADPTTPSPATADPTTTTTTDPSSTPTTIPTRVWTPPTAPTTTTTTAPASSTP
jgi:hypothetical protein